MSNASTFRRYARVEADLLARTMPALPSGVRSPFVFRSDRQGVVVAAVAGTRLVRQEVARG